MNEWTVVIMVLVSIFMISSAGIFGYWLRLRHLYRHMPKMANQLKDMNCVIEELQGQLDSQIAELTERLDFTERALTEGAWREHDSPLPTPP